MCEFKCDMVRLLRKGDIYNCDLGENGDIQDSGLLAKNRPCVIVSSNTMNTPRQYIYQIAPIRTEHILEGESIEYIVSERRKQGRIYVPIEMRPGDVRFIDITQMRPIHISRISSYQGSIINDDLMIKINAAIMELYYDRDELISSSSSTYNYSIETVEEDKIIEIPQPQPMLIEEVEETAEEIIEPVKAAEPKKKKKKGGRKPSFPMGFSKYYMLYKKGEITVPKLSEIFKMPLSTTYAKIKQYGELHPELDKKIKKETSK